MLYDVFDMCLYMMLVYDLAYVFGLYNFDDFAICTPVYGGKFCNELCYKDPLCSMGLCYYVIMWLCYHDVMMSYEFVLSMTFIVNTVMSCVIKLQYTVCCPGVMMFCLEKIFHCKYCIDLCYKDP